MAHHRRRRRSILAFPDGKHLVRQIATGFERIIGDDWIAKAFGPLQAPAFPTVAHLWVWSPDMAPVEAMIGTNVGPAARRPGGHTRRANPSESPQNLTFQHPAHRAPHRDGHAGAWPVALGAGQVHKLAWRRQPEPRTPTNRVRVCG